MAKREIAKEMVGVFTPLHNSKPMTELEALMQTPPGESPEVSIYELQPLREAVAESIELLDEQDRFIIEALLSEQISLQQLASRMGITKTHVWRLRNKAFEKLESIMSANPIIRRKIKVAETWNESASQWLTHLSTLANEPKELNIADLQAQRNYGAEVHLAQSPPSHNYWTGIAVQAINHLRLTDAWDTGCMLNTLCSKQHDYGHNNINRFGLLGVIVRLSDKIERYANLVHRENAVPNETIVDTVIDIVGYCVVALMLNDGTFDLALSADWNRK